HRKGTRYGIHVAEDGLLTAGEPGVQLTWMDARVGDWVVTPRQGKPVEINALWYNALRIAAEVSRRVADERRTTNDERPTTDDGHSKSIYAPPMAQPPSLVVRRSSFVAPSAALAEEWDALADRVRRSFRRRFWGVARGYLADVVDGPELEADFSL